MRFILCLFALFIFAQPVSAQCVDIPSCKGAEVESRLRGLQMVRETEEARPTNPPKPTKTPIPPTSTYTPIPPTKTNTPEPVATATAIPTVQPSATALIVPTVTIEIVIPTVKRDAQMPSWGWNVIGLIGLGLILFAAVGLRKPTTK